jgi:hypothetical protein
MLCFCLDAEEVVGREREFYFLKFGFVLRCLGPW